MGHEITNADNFGYVGQKAWHGLGVELDSGLSAMEAFHALGLGWATELIEVPDAKTSTGETVTVPDHRLHVRLDTATCLGVVGKDYKPISNQEMAQFADLLAGEDKAIHVETGGSLRGGKRVFVLVKLPNDTEVLDDDVLRNYVCISNGHDGVNSFNVFHTPVRVVCANTLRMAESSMRGARFAHTGDIGEKVELARAALGIIINQTETFGTSARALAKVSLKKQEIADYFDKVYARTFGDKHTDKHSEVVISAWRGNMAETRNTVASTEGTAWHALNAVTFWHDHQRGRFKAVAESQGRVHSNLFGTSARDKNIAFREAMALI